MAAIYVLAGINHFVHPAFYVKIIPPYLGNAGLINYVAGMAELILGAGLLFERSRKIAALGVILMLFAFLPAHIFMLQQAPKDPALSAPLWFLWVRLLLIQPLLIWWAWRVGNIEAQKRHPVKDAPLIS